MRCDRIWFNARLLTMTGSGSAAKVEDGAVACRNGRIVFAGPKSLLPTFLAADERIDCRRRWITPGLIDCHTHLVYAGNRSAEFERRLDGATYEEIAKQGGGIVSSVKATRCASESELSAASGARLDRLIAEGVTTVEIKSGYGLSMEAEEKQLRVARSLGAAKRVDVVATFLGAHALPPEVKSKDAYIDTVCNEMLPRLAKAELIDAVDGFCESIAFSPEQIDRVFKAARALGFPVKLHAEQLSNSGGTMLAARHGALSADHLEYVDENAIAAMAAAGTVAVLLPGAFYFLREKKHPPVDLFRQHGVPIAVATDCNPGTSPLTSLLLTMNMAATLFGMTVQECLAGVTREAARALGRLQDIGTIEVGKWCNLAIWDIDEPAELVYRMGFNPLHARVWRGQK